MKTDKRELLKKLQKNPTENIYEAIIKYCKRNINSINWNLKVSDDKALITAASSYLMKYKIGKWDSKDAIFMIYFFGNTVAKKFGIVDRVKIKLMSEFAFEKKYQQEARGICIYNPDSTCVVIYNPKIVTQLMSKNSHDFINGIQSIAYEMTHAYQNILIHDNGKIEPYNREQYIMALEEAAKSTTEEFYDECYVSLYKENQAELQAIDFAISILQQYKKSNILEKNEQFIMQKKSVCQKRQRELKRNKSDLSEIPVSRTELDARMSLHLIPELLEQYPILKIAFDSYGHKKGIVTLLNERKQMLKKADKDNVDELYKCILTETLINGESNSVEKELSVLPKNIIGEAIQKQQAVLKQYIAKTNSTDKFAKDLLLILTRKQKIGEQEKKNNKKRLQQSSNENDISKKVISMQENKANKDALEKTNIDKMRKNSVTKKNAKQSEKESMPSKRVVAKQEKLNKQSKVLERKKTNKQQVNVKNKQVGAKTENKPKDNSKQIQISEKVTNKQQDDLDKKEYNVLMRKLEEARKKGYSNTQKKISAKIKQRSGYEAYLSADSSTQPINPYFKDYMDKKEFEEHMKKVEEAKRCGDKKMLMTLSSEMIDRSGYGRYLSNESKVQPVNLYFKDYMDKYKKLKNKY